MPANDYVRFRIDPVIRNEAAAVLAKMGLRVSDPCRMALTRVAHEKRLPFSKVSVNECVFYRTGTHAELFSL